MTRPNVPDDRNQLVGWVERSDIHHLLPFAKNHAIMRDIACPTLGIDAELHHAVE
jgi:hypothetical protein